MNRISITLGELLALLAIVGIFTGLVGYGIAEEVAAKTCAPAVPL